MHLAVNIHEDVKDGDLRSRSLCRVQRLIDLELGARPQLKMKSAQTIPQSIAGLTHLAHHHVRSLEEVLLQFHQKYLAGLWPLSYMSLHSQHA